MNDLISRQAALWKGGVIMATRKELVEALRLIKDHCEEYDGLSCRNECPLISVCAGYFVIAPANWVILEGRDAVDEIEAEGGTDNGSKTN